MPVTIRDLCALPGLGLRLETADRPDGPEVRWVHVSEIEDPSPWLKGGELLLTTGLQLLTPQSQRDFVHHLADTGSAGIGFGVGVTHETVPPELIRVADERGLAVIRIPLETPYLAISEAVSEMLAADRYDAISRAFNAQQRLTRAALRSTEELVAELSRQLRGWAILADALGEVITAHPPQSVDRMPALLPDLLRARSGGGHATILTDEASSVIQPLSVEGLARGYLLAGIDGRIGTYERSVLTSAIGLLALEAERTHAVTLRLHRLRSATLSQAIHEREPSREFVRQLIAWGIDPDAVHAGVFLTPADRAEELLEKVLSFLTYSDLIGAVAVIDEGKERNVVAIVGDTSATDKLAELADAEGVTLGIGAVSSAREIRRAYLGARHAATIGRTGGERIVRFADLAAMKLLLGSSDSGALYDYLDVVLGPLMRGRATPKNAVLKETLSVFLDCNGRWSEAAARLDVHRHTLRTRMERISELTGRDPESSYDRMELSLALLIEDTFDPSR
ncbi:MAG: PucR family transcriptional regulator ligand-binding domain-containing protein [Microbacterium sp.]